MQLRYTEQLEQREAAIDAEATRISTAWITSLEEKIEFAFQELDPRSEVSVYSNAITTSPPIEAIKTAASRVADHFNGLGFGVSLEALGSVTDSNGRTIVGVRVSWGEL